MRKNFDMVRKNRYSEFMRGFSTITSKLKEMYQMITLGGDAELELVDSLDPFTEGINFRSACIICLSHTISDMYKMHL
jgi:structural maintenance of chromosome 4